MKTLKKLQAYMTGRKILLPLSLFLSAISSLMAMLPLLFIWLIVKQLFHSPNQFSQNLVTVYGLAAMGTAIGSILFYFISLSFSHLAAFRAEVNMRRRAMKKIVHMPLGFFDNNTSGQIRKNIDENTSITHMFLAHQLPDLVGTIVTPLMTVILILVFDWRLGVACFIPIIGAFAMIRFMMGKKGKRFMSLYLNALEEMNTEAVEYVRGIPVVKVFQQTVYSFKNFYNSILKYKEMVYNYTVSSKKSMAIYITLINSIVFFLVPAAILIIGRTGNIPLVLLNLLFYILLTPIFSESIMKSMYLTRALDMAREAVDRMENLIKMPGLPVSEAPQSISTHAIRFEKVSFTYPGTTQKAIDEISFTVPRGKTFALVGASGGGKTTIARLVPRFWDADSGQVSIGETNVKDILPNELMEQVSFVFQNTRLFKTSIRENICFGTPHATAQQIEYAVEQAQCRQIISRLPAGLETKIGIDGTYLSGGEQQRIALARAFLKNAPLVVLDEATAFADPENEHLIQKALAKLTKGKTVLMIAHRLTSVRNVDSILVINQGKIAEQGTHSELLEKNGIYQHMWNEYQKSVAWTISKEARHA